MATNPRVAEALRLYGEVSQPVVALLYAGRPADALAELDRQRLRVDRADWPLEVREAVQRRLDYLCHQAAKLAQPSADPAEAFFACYERLSAPAHSPAAQVMRAIVLLEALVHASRLGWTELPEAQMYELLATVPHEDRDPECWFYIAAWAFENDDLPLLEQAYEVSLLNPTDFRDQYPFQRVKLMHRFLRGELTAAEVTSVLGQMELLPEVLEFRRHIWPRLEAAGLGSPELLLLLDSREAALRAQLRPPADGAVAGDSEQSLVA